MKNNVEEIKSRLSITDVVGSYIKLEKAGANLKAKCPFHNEKTPSFYVSPDRGTYYCFGCEEKGDIFSFVEKFEGLDFKGALKVLAEKAGVKLERFSREASDSSDRLYAVLEEAALYFESCLEKDAEAKAYIENRGIKEKTASFMRLGYAPDEWRSLKDCLKGRGYSEKEMLEAGLIKRSEKASQDPYYDVFRGRIMFPIADSSGRVVGFSGRILKSDPEAPKYLNTPETKLYNKSNILYGLDKAKQAIRKFDYAILVEGQMDLVMSHQAGLSNTVAVSGTAFSADDSGRQGLTTGIGLVKRLSKNVIMAFDSDVAGYKATLRAAREALSAGMEVKAVAITGGKDPADIIKDDPKAWIAMLKTAKPIVEFIIARIKASNPDEKELAERVKNEVLPYVVLYESVLEQDRLIEYLSYETGMRSDALRVHLSRVPLVPEASGAREDTRKRGGVPSRLEEIERKIFGMVFRDPKSLEENGLRELLGEPLIERYSALPEAEKGALAVEYETLYPKGISEKEYKELVDNLRYERLKKAREKVAIELKKAERDKDSKRSKDLLEEFNRLSRELAV